MRQTTGAVMFVAALLIGLAIAQDQTLRKPLTFALDCKEGDCPLLRGKPQTSGMRGVSVKLKPGESLAGIPRTPMKRLR